MKQISLSKGYYAQVDEEDFEILSKHNWWICEVKSKRATVIQLSAQTEINGKTVKMHRMIMNPPKGMDIDHADGNPLNNQKYNLRICNRQENLRNTNKYKRRKKCSSEYKGVSFHKKANKWEAGLQVEGRRKWLGLFESEIEAAKVYNKAALTYFGEFARINKIQE
jgi:predicted RNA methylase